MSPWLAAWWWGCAWPPLRRWWTRHFPPRGLTETAAAGDPWEEQRTRPGVWAAIADDLRRTG